MAFTPQPGDAQLGWGGVVEQGKWDVLDFTMGLMGGPDVSAPDVHLSVGVVAQSMQSRMCVWRIARER